MSAVGADELVDVRQAAELTGRHPETVRRWVWSGRLPARRQRGRLLVLRRDVLAVAGVGGEPSIDLAAWAERAERALRESAKEGVAGSAADVVLEDRATERRGGPGSGR